MRLIDADAFIRYADEPSIFDTTDLKAMIGEQPTIEAAPVVHGRWIYHLYAPYGGSYVTMCCSRCYWEIPYSEERGSFNRSPFCPNCGAKMDEKEHNNA